MKIPEARLGPQDFWSFRGTIEYGYMGSAWIRREFWFSDYWSKQSQLWSAQSRMLDDWIGPVLILILIFQILVTAFSVLLIFAAKHKLFLYSAISLNALLLLCMLFVTFALDYEYDKSLSVGFWLSSASLVLFAAVALISRNDN